MSVFDNFKEVSKDSILQETTEETDLVELGEQECPTVVVYDHAEEVIDISSPVHRKLSASQEDSEKPRENIEE